MSIVGAGHRSTGVYGKVGLMVKRLCATSWNIWSVLMGVIRRKLEQKSLTTCGRDILLLCICTLYAFQNVLFFCKYF